MQDMKDELAAEVRQALGDPLPSALDASEQRKDSSGQFDGK